MFSDIWLRAVHHMFREGYSVLGNKLYTNTKIQAHFKSETEAIVFFMLRMFFSFQIAQID